MILTLRKDYKHGPKSNRWVYDLEIVENDDITYIKGRYIFDRRRGILTVNIHSSISILNLQISGSSDRVIRALAGFLPDSDETFIIRDPDNLFQVCMSWSSEPDPSHLSFFRFFDNNKSHIEEFSMIYSMASKNPPIPGHSCFDIIHFAYYYPSGDKKAFRESIHVSTPSSRIRKPCVFILGADFVIKRVPGSWEIYLKWNGYDISDINIRELGRNIDSLNSAMPYFSLSSLKTKFALSRYARLVDIAGRSIRFEPYREPLNPMSCAGYQASLRDPRAIYCNDLMGISLIRSAFTSSHLGENTSGGYSCYFPNITLVPYTCNDRYLIFGFPATSKNLLGDMALSLLATLSILNNLATFKDLSGG